MSSNDPSKTLETRLVIRDSECGSGEIEDELEKLESDVNRMAQKILFNRETLPDQLTTMFGSIISAQRPILPATESESEPPGPSGQYNPDSRGHGESSRGTTTVEEELKAIADKACLLKDTIARNVSAMPTVLKRMRESISRIDKLDSYNGSIHPAFKKRKPS